MSFGPKIGDKNSFLKSTWTPLTNEAANQKIFTERRDLINKWFEKWTDQQRKIVLQDLMDKCKTSQVEFVGNIANVRRPRYHEDFTRVLPKVITMYIFSFLDPRSLSRCARVCWFWKYLSEFDQLWLPKCVRLGWVLPFQPNPFETGVWKRHYVENIVSLRCIQPKEPPTSNFDKMGLMSARDRPKSRGGNKNGRPPWKGSDPVPKDTWRNNYIGNESEVDKVNRLRKKGMHGKESNEIMRTAKTKVKTGKHKGNTETSIRSKSMADLSAFTGERPYWARPLAEAQGDGNTYLFTKTGNEKGIQRPAPVRDVSPTTKRTSRDPPSEPLFKGNPWTIPVAGDVEAL